jgi:hypothetical protein
MRHGRGLGANLLHILDENNLWRESHRGSKIRTCLRPDSTGTGPPGRVQAPPRRYPTWLACFQPACLSDKIYMEKILPRLAAVTYSSIAPALGISQPHTWRNCQLQASSRKLPKRHPNYISVTSQSPDEAPITWLRAHDHAQSLQMPCPRHPRARPEEVHLHAGSRGEIRAA